ncbi:MAG: adenylosuccinate synthase [Candidatus Schekmanbacteria bacterium]|nr:adenylosuccinate synthase [Candidatus Schekmanbacteria bacterium]
MANVIVVGAQWGDEGKAKVVDLLASHADACVRYQGGHNAGHTVEWQGRRFIFHLVPTGILRPEVRCFIGSGVVLDPEALFTELAGLEAMGVSSRDRIRVSYRAHLILPYHRLLERASERRRGAARIGTTGRGIGPAYEDKVGRRGIVAADLLDGDALRRKITANVARVRRLVEAEDLTAEGEAALDVEVLVASMREHGEKLAPMLADVSLELDALARAGRGLLFEGAQGTMLDVDHGTYPHVTSSSCVAAGALTSLGIGPRRVDAVIGVSKAYTTRVGEGPFPSELEAEPAAHLRRLGGEYGATTGRPRRCGWLDLCALRYAARVNGLDALALTKLDILDSLPEIPVCVGYRLGDRVIDEFPPAARDWYAARPVYEVLPAWSRPVAGARTAESLAPEVHGFVRRVEELVGAPVALICTGSDRDDIVVPRGSILRDLYPNLD